MALDYDKIVAQYMAKLREAEAAKQAAEDAKNRVAQKKATSNKEVVRYLTARVDRSLDTGNVDSSIMKAYLSKIDQPEVQYLRLAGKLLNSRYYGIDTNTTRIDSADKLRWLGKDYENVQGLLEAITGVLGNSPLRGSGWFRELCQMTLTAPDELDGLLNSGARTADLYQTFKERYSDQVGRIDYNEDVLTTEDSLYLAGLTAIS